MAALHCDVHGGAGHTVAVLPETTLPLIGFDTALVNAAPFVRLTGMFLLCLTLVTFHVRQRRIEAMVPGTVIIRVFVITTLLIVAVAGGFPFLYFMAAVVAVGMVGTLWSLGIAGFLRYL